MPARHAPTQLLLSRPGMEPLLHAECVEAGLRSPECGPECVRVGSPLPAGALLFERQRLPEAQLLPSESLRPFDESACARICAQLFPDLRPWALHLFASEQEDAKLDRRLPGLERLLRKAAKQVHADFPRYERKAEKLFLQDKGAILQAFLCSEGLWLSASAPRNLTATRPGGRYRMKMDPDAPSRSFLKMEEALARMPVTPEQGERVVDLGAAPGGWTWAFVKRGCEVTAVDNGPLRLPERAMGQVHHLREDGMRYKLPGDPGSVDWLVGDMLVPPGKAFGLLRYWMGGQRARRVVMNIKLPQTHPLPALLPLQEWLAQQSAWEVEIRQLYHDRREVTVLGLRKA